MVPIKPELHENAIYVEIAKNQSEYITLPASIDENGLIMTEWELSAEELHKLFTGGRLRLWIYTFRHPMQPVSLEVIGGDNV